MRHLDRSAQRAVERPPHFAFVLAFARSPPPHPKRCVISTGARSAQWREPRISPLFLLLPVLPRPTPKDASSRPERAARSGENPAFRLCSCFCPFSPAPPQKMRHLDRSAQRAVERTPHFAFVLAFARSPPPHPKRCVISTGARSAQWRDPPHFAFAFRLLASGSSS